MSDSNVTRISSSRRAQRERRKAQSLYGQIRLTVTFEASGAISYRAMAKPYDAGWQESRVFAQGAQRLDAYPEDFHGALDAFQQVAGLLRWMPSERH